MKIFRYILYIVAACVAIWFSFYIEPLSVKLQQEALKHYNPEQLIEYHWSNDLSLLREDALSLDECLAMYRSDNAKLMADYGHVLGIGSNPCYAVKGVADSPVYEDNSIHFLYGDVKVSIPTKYIFGNVAREACGWFRIDDFQNTMDFNSVSACLNQRIREQVIADKPQHVSEFQRIVFCGAIELPQQAETSDLTLYPYYLDFE